MKSKAQNKTLVTEKDLSTQLAKAKRSKDKLMEMFDNDIITIDELKAKTKELDATIDKLIEEIKLLNMNISKSDILENVLNETFKDLDNVVNIETMTNAMLSRIIEKIEVDEKGNVDVYLKLLSEIGIDENVLIQPYRTLGCSR